MAVEQYASGTWDASVPGLDVWDELAVGVDQGTYVVRVNTANMLAGDALVMAAVVTDTAVVDYYTDAEVVATDAPGDALYAGVSPAPIVVPQGGAGRFFIKQSLGTLRTYTWLLVRLF